MSCNNYNNVSFPISLLAYTFTVHCFTSQPQKKTEIIFPILITGDFTSFNSELTFSSRKGYNIDYYKSVIQPEYCDSIMYNKKRKFHFKLIGLTMIRLIQSFSKVFI